MMDVDNDKEFFRYKYVPFGDDKLSLDIITKGTIKFTCPLDFNDPFDCQPNLSISKIRESIALKDKVAQIPKHLSFVERKINEDRIERELIRLVESGELFKCFLNKVGVLSLSRRYDSALMWSHYADFHKGYVVGFKYSYPDDHHLYDKGDIKNEARDISPIPVNYSKVKPTYFFGQDGFDPNVLLTKSDVWLYEEEERAFGYDKGHGIHDYDRDKRLHCVIAGAKITTDDFKLLKNAVIQASKELGRKIKFKQAKLSQSTYGLEFVDIKYKF